MPRAGPFPALLRMAVLSRGATFWARPRGPEVTVIGDSACVGHNIVRSSGRGSDGGIGPQLESLDNRRRQWIIGFFHRSPSDKIEKAQAGSGSYSRHRLLLKLGISGTILVEAFEPVCENLLIPTARV